MAQLKTGTVEANGTRLYHEVRGRGPAVLFISGATGDAGHFEGVAEQLADELTVVTYDRRGNSRSPRPGGWNATTMEEQADDAAALVRALGISPVAVFGTSGGAIIATSLLLRHPEGVRGAILHEPPMVAVVTGEAENVAQLRAMIETEMARGGPPAAVEAFVRFAAGPAFDRIPPGLRARMSGNGETLFGVELERFLEYRPSEAALAAVDMPVRILVGTETAPMYEAASRWLAGKLRARLGFLAGAHAPYFDRPAEMAEALRPLLRELR